MSWNNGYERKRFEEKLRKQREEYKRQGMNDAQIEEIEALDWEIFKSDRRFFSHTQPLDYDDDFENEARNPYTSLICRQTKTAMTDAGDNDTSVIRGRAIKKARG